MAPRRRDEDSTLEHGRAPRPAAPGDLLLVAGAGELITHALTRGEIVIGRGDDCDLILADRALSRRHAVLRLGPPVTVQDLGSTNGTRAGATRRTGGAPIEIGDGEAFHIGPYSFVVVRGGHSESSRRSTDDPLRIDDPAVEQASPLLRDIAASGVSVLILGETGVGKEVLAETLHALSGRPGPMVRVNCAALSESLLESELFGHQKGAFTGAAETRAGLLEAAAGGTVLLDEAGEIPAGIQAKLLRAIEAREVLRLGATRPVRLDVRFVAATNRELPAEVEAGRFRRDLFFRLDGITLRIPPLRERRGSIVPLAMKFLSATRPSRAPSLASDVLAALEAYAWPGNVRELKAVIERAVLLSRGREIARKHLALAPLGQALAPPPPADELAFLDADQRRDRARILAALERYGGNQTRAARALGMSRSTLVTRLQLYRIPRPKA